MTIEGAWASAMPFCYSSEYCDDDLGLVYYNYRHYNPHEGRWVTRDPIGEQGGENLYEFVSNCPVMNIDTYGLRQTYDSIEEAKIAGLKSVMEAMNNSYKKLLDAGYQPPDLKNMPEFSERKNEAQKKKERNRILKEFAGDDKKLFDKLMEYDAKLGKWEYGIRVCCDSKRKFYLGEVGTKYNPEDVNVMDVPGCDKGDTVVAYIHTHTDHDPTFSGPDERTARQGLRHSNPQVAMPSGIIIMSTVETGDGNILSYEYNAGVNSRDTYDNYIKRKKR